MDYGEKCVGEKQMWRKTNVAKNKCGGRTMVRPYNAQYPF
jgi:hypothetical protein